MRILIAGASGHVGGRLAAVLAERGEDPTLLARDPGRPRLHALECKTNGIDPCPTWPQLDPGS